MFSFRKKKREIENSRDQKLKAAHDAVLDATINTTIVADDLRHRLIDDTHPNDKTAAILFDRDGCVKWANHRAAKIFHMEIGDLRGCPIASLFHCNHFSSGPVWNLLRSALSSATPVVLSGIRDNETFPLQSLFIPLDEGNGLEMLMLMRGEDACVSGKG